MCNPWLSSSARAGINKQRQTLRWCRRSMMLTNRLSLVRYMTLEGQVRGTSQEPGASLS